MHRTLLSAALFTAIAFSFGSAQAASFTYHGNLQDAGKPAEGTYDLELTLYSSPEGGKVIAGPLVMYKVPVHEGTFSTEADFGQLTNVAGQSWLSVKVRNAGNGEFAALSARAPISADAKATSSTCPGSWSLDGNAGNPAGDYLGTADTQPLVLKTNSQRIVVTDLSGGGTVPRWIGGGSLNVSSNGVGSFIGGGGSSSVSAQRNEVGAFCVVAGGDTNTARGTNPDESGGPTGYATIGGGRGNTASGYVSTVAGGGGFEDDGNGHQVPAYNTASGGGSTVSGGQGNIASGVASSVSGGDTNLASGLDSAVAGGDDNQATGIASFVAGGGFNKANGTGSFVAGGLQNIASGNESFAGGFYAQANDAGSFVWSDGTSTSGNRFSSTGVNQFLVRANGGMAINGPPKSNGVELSMYPTGNAGNYSNMFFGLIGQTAGVLTSAGDASSATSNDASFYFDDFDGTTQTRMLTIAPVGITAGGIPLISQVAMLPKDSTAKMVLSTFGTQVSDLTFAIYKVPTAGGAGTSLLEFNSTGAMTISNALAQKPGGGMWTATSDRRIKQDISPIRDALDTVMKLRPVNFRYTPEYRAMEGGLADRPYAGFIAQEYADVFPTDVISTSKNVPGAAKGDPTILALDPNPALITTVAAVQELAVDNIALHKQIDELLARLNKLEVGKGQ